MILYRALHLANLDFDRPDAIGKHWTFDYDKAYPYGSKKQIDFYYIYVANVHIDSVCFEETKNAPVKSEREIVLLQNSIIDIIRIDKVTILPVKKRKGKFVFTKQIETVNGQFKTIV